MNIDNFINFLNKQNLNNIDDLLLFLKENRPVLSEEELLALGVKFILEQQYQF